MSIFDKIGNPLEEARRLVKQITGKATADVKKTWQQASNEAQQAFSDTKQDITSTVQPKISGLKSFGQHLKESWSEGVGRVKQSDFIDYTPLSLFPEATKATRGFANVAKTDTGKKFWEITGGGMRGASRLHPFGVGSALFNREEWESTAPRTQTEKKAADVAEFLYGSAFTYPLGGIGGILGRTTAGGLLGGGIKAGSNVLTGDPVFKDIEQGIASGAKNSWQLAITNAVTDAIAGQYIPGLTSKSISQSSNLLKNVSQMGLNESKKKILTSNLKKLFLRALLEVPVENTWFTATDQMGLKNKEGFVKSWIKNLPGNVVGNLAFAGLQAGKSGFIDYRMGDLEAAKNALKKTFSSFKSKLPEEYFKNKKSGFIDVGGGAREDLEHLINYPKKLRQMGFSKKQIDQIGSKEAKRILDQDIQPFNWKGEPFGKEEVAKRQARGFVDEGVDPGPLKKFHKWMNNKFSPLANTPDYAKKLVNDWNSQLLTSKQKADRLAAKFEDIPEKDGYKLIKYIQNPSKLKASQLEFEPKNYKKEIKEIRSAYDNLLQEGRDAGLSINYIKNYINQVWEEGYDEIAKKTKGLGTKPSFTKEKVIPSYTKGIDLGLTPRFTHPAQLVAHYRFQLDKAIANKKLLKGLVDEGIFLPETKAPFDWKKIDAPFVPRAVEQVGKNKTVIQDYAAPPSVAKALNNLFEYKKGGATAKLAALSKAMQDLTMSAGYRTANAWSIGQVLKEFTALRFKSPVTSFNRSFSDEATKEYLKDNQKYLDMLAKEGVDVRTNKAYTELFNNLEKAKTKGLVPSAKRGWKLFTEQTSEPTFKNFLPMLQVNFFKDTYEKALKEGVSNKQAREVAAKALKNFYGITDHLARSKKVDDTLSAMFFAPRYRESMLNFWVKNLQSLTPKKVGDKAYKANRKFIAGLVGTYFGANLINKATTGRWIHENKAGKRMHVEIPLTGKRSLYLPILPGVMTLPRTAVGMVEHLVEGDVRGFFQKGSRFLSKPAQLGIQLASDRSWFGGPITDYDAPPGKKWKQRAGYAVSQALGHPFITNPVDVAQGRKKPISGLLNMAEIPVYESSSTKYKEMGGVHGLESGLKDQFTEAFINQDKEQMADSITELKKLGVEPDDVIIESFVALEEIKDPDKKKEVYKRLVKVAKAVGLDPARIQTAIKNKTFDQKYKNKLINNLVDPKTPVEEKRKLLLEAKALGIRPETIKKRLAKEAYWQK